MTDSLPRVGVPHPSARQDGEELTTFVCRMLREVAETANAGYLMAVQIGYHVADYLWTNLPAPVQRHYEENNLILRDPLVMWARQNPGWTDIEALRASDEHRFFEQAASFGLHHGIVVSIPHDGRNSAKTDSRRSMGAFYRGDRRFTDAEAQGIHDRVAALHFETGPRQPLDRASRDFLRALTESMVAPPWR